MIPTEMSMLHLILTLIIIGLLWYLAETYIPMAPPMKVIVRVVCLLAVIIYLARALGVL
jgi:hypothetical protein